MTTRTRANKLQQQARDSLESLCREWDAIVVKRRAVLQEAEVKREKAKRAWEALGQPMLDGWEAVKMVDTLPIIGEGGTGDDLSQHSGNAPYCPDALQAESVGQAPGINDVWANDGTVSVHTTLMYARQDLCEWCRVGVPFATEKRTEHYVVTRDEMSVARGVEYKPCEGVEQ